MILFLCFILLIFQNSPVQSIQWQQGGWANGCDFVGQDLSKAQVEASQCGPTCQSTNKCTHYSWTNYNGGTCWMKSGSVSQSYAISISDQSTVCGIIGI